MTHARTRGLLTIVTALAASLAACGGGGGEPPTTPPPPPPPPTAVITVATVEVSPPASNLTPQQTVQLTAVLKDAAGAVLTGRSIAWAASNQNATVSSTGLVTAAAAGAVTITATSEGKSGSAQVTVAGPVATVVVSATSTTLIPQQTLQLTVVLTDAGGAPLTGRTVGWTSSAAQVATVSDAGLVTGLTAGSTTITATSEGKSGTIVLTVGTGAVVGASGGTVTADNGAIEVMVPAGAVTTATPISLTLLAAPTEAPPANVQFNGPVYQLGPSGLTFAQPVTIKLKYDVATMPKWAMTGDLAIFGSNGTQWTALTNVVVDVATGTISGKTSSFGTAPAALRTGGALAEANPPGPNVTTGVNYASVTLTPATASVNFQQRSVSFHVHLVPVGNSLTIPAPGATAATPQWKFRWRTTGQNGVLGSGGNVTGWTTNTDELYVATNAQLNTLSGPIDVVYVDVLLNPAEENNPPAQRIRTQQVTVDADLKTTYEVSPSDKTINAGAAQVFQLVMRDKEGNILQPLPNSEITWLSSAFFGTLSGGANQPTTTYTAKTTFTAPPPRVDDVKVSIVGKTTVTNREVQWDFSHIPPTLEVIRTTTETRQLQGDAKGFVTVKVDYQVQLLPATKTIGANTNTTLTASITPSEPGVMYKYTNPGVYGTLNVANGVRTAATEVTYTAKATGGGTDKVKVEVVSMVAGVEVETLGSAESSVTVDQLTAGFSVSVLPTAGGWFTSAQISVPKIAGATSYEVTATTPDGPYVKTFSGATSTDQFSVGQVLDGGSSWKINIEGGFNTIAVAQQARANLYQTKYGGVQFKIKVTP